MFTRVCVRVSFSFFPFFVYTSFLYYCWWHKQAHQQHKNRQTNHQKICKVITFYLCVFVYFYMVVFDTIQDVCCPLSKSPMCHTFVLLYWLRFCMYIDICTLVNMNRLSYFYRRTYKEHPVSETIRTLKLIIVVAVHCWLLFKKWQTFQLLNKWCHDYGRIYHKVYEIFYHRIDLLQEMWFTWIIRTFMRKKLISRFLCVISSNCKD